MKASLLKRLEAPEKAASQTAIPRLRIIDVFQLPDEDRDAYWSGDVDVLNRYAPPIPDMPLGTITTIIVSVHPESREPWDATRTMTDVEYEAWDEIRIQESEQPATVTPVVEKEPEIQFDKYGYRLS